MCKRINVYNDDGEIVARVNYSNNLANNLDHWSGSNWTVGHHAHAGITRLKSGEYVIIHSTDYLGDVPRGEIVSKEEALKWILQADSCDELLAFPKYAELKEMADKLDEQTET
jgi:hypothetical protein